MWINFNQRKKWKATMLCIEVFAAGDSLAPTAWGRTLTLVAFAAWPSPVTTWCFTYWKFRMDIFWNKQVRKFSINTTMFYVNYYLAYSYGLWLFKYHYFITNTIIYKQVNKKSKRGCRDMLNIFCLFVLHIRIATIINKNAKFKDKFLFRYHSAISTKSKALS